jgi:hypothetical protein
MRTLFAAPIAALTLLTLPGAAPQRNAVPEATPAGKPIDCVSLRNIRETKVRDDSTIDFVMRGGKVYRNDLRGIGCPRLGFEKRFLYKTTLSQICSVDTITVLQDPGLSQGATCGLGEFQPVTLAKR